ncbi:MAG: hypothetical protein RR313_01815, partial [Anaerovoracaceae bacterium]
MSNLDIHSTNGNSKIDIATEQTENKTIVSSDNSSSNISTSSKYGNQHFDLKPSKHSLGKLSNVSPSADITANTEKIIVKLANSLEWSVVELKEYITAHNHENKNLLDLFSMSINGQLLFDGSEIAGGATADHDHTNKLIRPGALVVPG